MIDDDIQTIVGDDEETAEAISKVVALHVIPEGLTIFALGHSPSVLRPPEVALPPGLERPGRRDDTRASSSFSSAPFRRADIDDRARSNVSRQLRRRSRSRCRLNDRLPLHIATKEMSLSAVSATRGRTKYGKKARKDAICSEFSLLGDSTSDLFKRANVSIAPAAAALPLKALEE